jgi:heavy metal translocating P-type ATPase
MGQISSRVPALGASDAARAFGKGEILHPRFAAMPKSHHIAIFAATAITLHVTLRYALGAPRLSWLIPLWATLAVGGIPLVWDLARKAARQDFGSDLLAGISIVTASLLGEYLVACIVILMLSGGGALEEAATMRASSVLQALARRMPQTAHCLTSSGVRDVLLSEIQPGDRLVVLPHEICPVDGVIIEGHGSMDESYLTGEPFDISKAPGSTALSGAINGEAALTVEATRAPGDSRYARIMRVIQESEQQRPKMRRMADHLGAWYTPLAVAIAAMGWVISGDPTRFLAVIVVATPCPLLIAIPVAIIGAISLAARRGVVIRNPAILEQIDTCRTLIFDKTGTLTYGKPILTEIVCMPGFSKDDVLRLVASLEQYSRHPLVTAVLDAAKRVGLSVEPATEVEEKPGQGLRGIVSGRAVTITGRAKVAGLVDLPPSVGGLECVALFDGAVAALFRFRDEPRAESKGFISHLTPRHRADRLILLSGDRELEAREIADRLGIGIVYGNQSPEQKAAVVRKETACAGTLFVGDGINDAPAMLAASAGVAFGPNSDVTAEAAGAVILDQSLAKVDELIHIGRRLRVIALQSAVGGMALSALAMIPASTGHLPPVASALAQEAIDLAAVLNALRTALPARDLSDF